MCLFSAQDELCCGVLLRSGIGALHIAKFPFFLQISQIVFFAGQILR